jgi:hypothetical protein
MDTTTAPTEVRFRRTRSKEWVLCGPADVLQRSIDTQEPVTVAKKGGGVRHLVPLRLGKPFTEDGILKCYGYMSEKKDDGRCGECDFLLPPDAHFCPRCGQRISDPRGVNDSRPQGGPRTIDQLAAAAGVTLPA